MNEQAIAKELQQSPKPIAIEMHTDDVRQLFAIGTSGDQYNQLLLAKFKDAGAPVEGLLRLKFAHGRMAKVKDSDLVPQEVFTYIWLPEAYVEAIAHGGGQA